MASPNPPPASVGPDTLITVKMIFEGNNRRFKLALRDLGANVLPQKLRLLLAIPPETEVRFDRFSDSAGDYITLDSNNPSIYKQLFRAAKAKGKLRLQAVIVRRSSAEAQTTITMGEENEKSEMESQTASSRVQAEPRQSYLETVLSQPPIHATAAPSFKAFQTLRPVIALSAAATSKNATTETLAPSSQSHQVLGSLSKPTLPTFNDFPSGAFSIDCNHCGKSIPDQHYHCSICEKGDFDLCQICVDQGMTCEGENHWLIKRFIKAGEVIPSVTETLPSRNSQPSKEAVATPLKEATRAPVNTFKVFAERTCNSCISEFPENELVTCKDCPDFDLCHACFQYGEHGHHPAHSFQPVDGEAATSALIHSLCEAGRGAAHEAICDGCDKHITGVRHKCLNCPDWDYCSACILSADLIHPGHRFVPLYEPISHITTRTECHYGIHCDGPLCVNHHPKAYIRGVRYKCAVCHDTDFCANCEAVPTNTHNKTHPLIKFKTHVRHVSVTTLSENGNGQKLSQLGDRVTRAAKNAATETTPPAPSANAATQVQTVAEVKPADIATSEISKDEVADRSTGVTSDLQAWFESDSTPDGTRFGPNRLVSQSWTLRNPGPQAWPAGCAVYYIGGDDMRNLDVNHPSSVSVMTTANRSNVLEHGLAPGMTAVFQVLLKSPPREGRVISYWRLKTPEGLPFGHKLWVDITVTTTRPEPEVEEELTTLEDDEIKSEESSTMIFPKLEKESPTSSIHEEAKVASVTAEPVAKAEEQELLEDIESLELDDEDTDDGFMTDEEYDILDASDEDFLMEAQQGLKQK